jgi:hypothetical protein
MSLKRWLRRTLAAQTREGHLRSMKPSQRDRLFNWARMVPRCPQTWPISYLVYTRKASFCFALSSTFSQRGSFPKPWERSDHMVCSSFDIGSSMVRKWASEVSRTISRCHSSRVKTRSWQSMLWGEQIRLQAPFLLVLRTGPLVTFESMTRRPCLVRDSRAPMMRSSHHRSQPRI